MFLPLEEGTPVASGASYTTACVLRGPYSGDILASVGNRLARLTDRLPWLRVTQVRAVAPGAATTRRARELGLGIPTEAYVGRWVPWMVEVDWWRPGSEKVETMAAVPTDETDAIPAVAIVAAAIAMLLLAVSGLLVVASITGRKVSDTFNNIFSPGFVVAVVVVVALFTMRGRSVALKGA